MAFKIIKMKLKSNTKAIYSSDHFYNVHNLSQLKVSSLSPSQKSTSFMPDGNEEVTYTETNL